MKFLTSQIYALKSREDFVYFAEVASFKDQVKLAILEDEEDDSSKSNSMGFKSSFVL